MKNKLTLLFLVIAYFVGVFVVRRGVMWILASPALGITAADLRRMDLYTIGLAACFWFLLPLIIHAAIKLGREQTKGIK